MKEFPLETIENIVGIIHGICEQIIKRSEVDNHTTLTPGCIKLIQPFFDAALNADNEMHESAKAIIARALHRAMIPCDSPMKKFQEIKDFVLTLQTQRKLAREEGLTLMDTCGFFQALVGMCAAAYREQQRTLVEI